MLLYLPYPIRISAILVISSVVQNVQSCFEPSEPLPAPLLDVHSPDLRQLFSDLNVTIENALINGNAPWNTTVSSFAVEVTSSTETLWRSLYTAPLLGNYTDGEPTKVTENTAFRIASISKVFTVLAILLQEQEGKLSMKDPVTKYLPGLAKGKIRGGVDWHHISLESLASQLSGVPRECRMIWVISSVCTD